MLLLAVGCGGRERSAAACCVGSSARPHTLPNPCAPAPVLLPQRSFEGVVADSKGFRWVNERPDATSENDEKWGWIASKPGDYVELLLDSRSSGEAPGDVSVGARRAAGRRGRDACTRLRPGAALHGLADPYRL